MDNKDLVMEIDYPILATKGVALFPHNDISVEAGRVFSKKAIRKSNESFNNIIVVVPQKNPTNDTISLKELSNVGTIAKIKTTRNYVRPSFLPRLCLCPSSQRKSLRA